LDGYSTKTSIAFLDGQNAKNNGLNVAKSGDLSSHMPNQIQMLLDRLKIDKNCDIQNDWKIITFFIGANDLCDFCKEDGHTPEKYLDYVTTTLDFLHKNFPKTFVNLVLVLNVAGVKDLNSGGFICQTLHKKMCNCAAFPTEADSKKLADYIPRFQKELVELVAGGRYDTNSDFTVVVQPFLTETPLPRLLNNDIDFSYFSPDCFHFSGKGHSVAALSLWNNMMEPVGRKRTSWFLGEQLECPSDKYPYFFTSKNSAQALSEKPKPPKPVISPPRPAMSTVPQTTAKEQQSILKPTIFHHHQHQKDENSHKEKQSSSSSLIDFKSKLTVVAGVGLFAFVVILLVVAISKRQTISLFINGRHTRFDDDEEVIWSKNQKKIKANIHKLHVHRTYKINFNPVVYVCTVYFLK